MNTTSKRRPPSEPAVPYPTLPDGGAINVCTGVGGPECACTYCVAAREIDARIRRSGSGSVNRAWLDSILDG